MAQEVRIQNLYAGKTLQIVGVVLVILGVLVMVGADGSAATAGLVVTVVGFAVFIVGRFKHWYHAE